MLKFVKENRIHFLIWGMMIGYLILAPKVYYKYFVKEGKPSKATDSLPVATKRIKGLIDRFEPIEYDGQLLYSMVGWAYSTKANDMQPEQYARYIALSSDTRNYLFRCTDARRFDIEKAFPDVEIDLTYSGCTVRIAKEALDLGIYEIGFVFKNEAKNTSSYASTKRFLIRTANTLVFKSKPTQ